MKKGEQEKQAEEEHKHSVDRVTLQKVTQCKEHKWRKLTETEIACTVCPTVNIVDVTDNYVK